MPRRSTRWYRKNEVKAMDRLGFKPTINSGAGWVQKEDGENEQCLCQLKSTDRNSISVNLNDLHILENNSLTAHKLPVFALQFIQTDEVWVMIKPEHLELIKKVLKDQDVRTELEELDVFNDLDIDTEQEKDYSNKSANKNYLARKKQNKQREEEREQNEKAYKERRKQWNLNKKQ